MMSPRDSHAIVVGGSMAGLLAARALVEHFGRVTIVDRDAFPTSPDYRKGVPQSPHAHVLLARGQLLLERFFPGLVSELRDQGAVPLMAPQDMLALTPMGWAMRSSPRPLGLLSCSRELLEFNVRRRLTRSTAIGLIEESDVVGLIPGNDGTSIDGVRLRRRGGDRAADATEDLQGALVVDASGRDSRMPEWLRAIGYDTPAETKVVSHAGYASRYYARPTGFVADWKVLFFLPSVGSPRGGVLFPIEGERWLVTLVGVGGDFPPTDEEGFLAFSRTLRTPILHDVISRSKPLSAPRGFRRTDNVRRAYEQLRRWPDGLIVTGDAACTFNPVYGQGMSVCAIEASELSRALVGRGKELRFAHTLQRHLARANSAPWQLATAADLAYPTTEGTRRGGVSRIISRYIERLQTVAIQDPVVASAFRYVTHLLSPPLSLFAPNIVVRVLAPRTIRRRDEPPMRMSFAPGTITSREAP